MSVIGRKASYYYLATDRIEFKTPSLLDLLRALLQSWEPPVKIVVVCNARDSLDDVLAAVFAAVGEKVAVSALVLRQH